MRWSGQYRRQQRHRRVALATMMGIIRRGRSVVGVWIGLLGQRLGARRESVGNRHHHHQSCRRRQACGYRLWILRGCPRPGDLLLRRKHSHRPLGQPRRISVSLALLTWRGKLGYHTAFSSCSLASSASNCCFFA